MEANCNKVVAKNLYRFLFREKCIECLRLCTNFRRCAKCRKYVCVKCKPKHDFVIMSIYAGYDCIHPKIKEAKLKNKIREIISMLPEISQQEDVMLSIGQLHQLSMAYQKSQSTIEIESLHLFSFNDESTIIFDKSCNYFDIKQIKFGTIRKIHSSLFTYISKQTKLQQIQVDCALIKKCNSVSALIEVIKNCPVKRLAIYNLELKKEYFLQMAEQIRSKNMDKLCLYFIGKIQPIALQFASQFNSHALYLSYDSVSQSFQDLINESIKCPMLRKLSINYKFKLDLSSATKIHTLKLHNSRINHLQFPWRASNIIDLGCEIDNDCKELLDYISCKECRFIKLSISLHNLNSFALFNAINSNTSIEKFYLELDGFIKEDLTIHINPNIKIYRLIWIGYECLKNCDIIIHPSTHSLVLKFVGIQISSIKNQRLLPIDKLSLKKVNLGNDQCLVECIHIKILKLEVTTIKKLNMVEQMLDQYIGTIQEIQSLKLHCMNIGNNHLNKLFNILLSKQPTLERISLKENKDIDDKGSVYFKEFLAKSCKFVKINLVRTSVQSTWWKCLEEHLIDHDFPTSISMPFVESYGKGVCELLKAKQNSYSINSGRYNRNIW